MFRPHNDRMSPMATVATADIEGSIAEIQRVAQLGFRGLTLPLQTVFNSQDARDPNYNMTIYDPMWAQSPTPISRSRSTSAPDAIRALQSRRRRRDENYVAHALRPGDRAGRRAMLFRRARAFSED